MMPHRDRASQDLAADLVVTAGAGAGKTTVLVNRFVNIARDPRIGPERILAITFTRKAAVEMKERAIRLFESTGEIDLRRRTEAAYISTIHGFTERLLRERAFDAELDPAFEVLTPYEQAEFFQRALEPMYARADLRALAARLGKTRDGEWEIFALVRSVAQLQREGSAEARREADICHDDDGLLSLARARIETAVARAGERMLDCLAEVEPLLASAVFKSRGVMFQECTAYREAVKRCLAKQSARAGASDIWRATRFTGQIDAEQRPPIRELLDQIKELAPFATFDDWDTQLVYERELIPLKRAVYAAAAEINSAYAEHKRSRGVLDFHDLQLRALDLLATRDDVRREYAERFRHILLDESQDTDELQYGIINALRTPENTLFMVGDPKQAIYEFRGANPDVFMRALEAVHERDRLQLAENFRSRHEIVDFVNAIGPALLGERFMAIEPRADYGGHALVAPPITALYAIQHTLPLDGKKKEPIGDVRHREAAAVAEELVALLRAETLVRDPNSREVRWTRLRPRHIALLFRTRTAIPYFERALAERGVPYVTSAGQGFYERAEVLDCLMLLKAVAQPLDDLAMASVLRSPFAGASDAELWTLRELSVRNGRTRPLATALRSHPTLAEFGARFRALRARTRGLSASTVLEDAIRTFGYEQTLAAHEDGPAMLANLAKVRRQVRDMGTASAYEASLQLVRARELLDAEPMAPLVGPADDVVVLTTVHQAKGLEWPVVCLPNLQGGAAGKSPRFSGRHGVLLCEALNDDGDAVKPFSLADIRDELKARSDAEERRLLYVALTRARERLILSASVPHETVLAPGKPAKPGVFSTPLAFLLAATGTRLMAGPGPHSESDPRVTLVMEMPAAVTPLLGGEVLATTFTLGAPVLVEPDAPLAPARPLAVKVTELLAYRRCAQVYRFAHVLEIQEHLQKRAAIRGERSRAVSPVELGTIVHGLLERAHFDASDMAEEADRLLHDQPAELRDRLRALLLPVLTSEVGEAVRTAIRVEREWPFAFELDGVLVEGVIDLAVQASDGTWTVFDYKSNDFSRTGRLEYLVDYYTPQLELYALALSRAGLGAVTGCALVFLTGPHVHRWSFDPALGTIDEWTRRTIDRIAAGDYTASAGPQCELCGYRKRKVCATGRDWTPDAGLATPERLRALSN